MRCDVTLSVAAILTLAVNDIKKAKDENENETSRVDYVEYSQLEHLNTLMK